MMRERELDKAGLLEGAESTILIDSLDCASREGKAHRLFEFRDVNLLCLKVCITSNHTYRVELGCSSGV